MSCVLARQNSISNVCIDIEKIPSVCAIYEKKPKNLNFD